MATVVISPDFILGHTKTQTKIHGLMAIKGLSKRQVYNKTRKHEVSPQLQAKKDELEIYILICRFISQSTTGSHIKMVV